MHFQKTQKKDTSYFEKQIQTKILKTPFNALKVQKS